MIKVGFCAAYDWELLKKSVPRVYPYADKLCLSLDKKRISWSGKPFDFDEESFFSWVRAIDKDNKIDVYEDDFYVSNNSSIQNDNLQRTLMAKRMGEGGWHVQVDADEYFLDFENFVKYILGIYPNPDGTEKPINICCNWVSLIKKNAFGYLYVNNRRNEYETMPFATNVPQYYNARRNDHFNHISPFFVLHETWARGEQQLKQKLENWGHDNDFQSKESYFALWNALDQYNYKYINNFHPLKGPIWQALGFIPETAIEKVISWLTTNHKLHIDKGFLLKKNNRIIQSLKQLVEGK